MFLVLVRKSPVSVCICRMRCKGASSHSHVSLAIAACHKLKGCKAFVGGGEAILYEPAASTEAFSYQAGSSF